MAVLNKFLYPLPPETETVHTVTTPVVFQHSFRQEERKRKKKRRKKTKAGNTAHFCKKEERKRGDRISGIQRRGIVCFHLTADSYAFFTGGKARRK